MTRPRERLGDAWRMARDIVDAEGADLARAARSGDREAIEAARDRLVSRIAEALLDTEHEVMERVAPRDESTLQPHFALFVRATH